MKISVLMPVYSETALLLESLDRLRQALGEWLHETVIVVAPGSTKECLDLCHSLPLTDQWF